MTTATHTPTLDQALSAQGLTANQQQLASLFKAILANGNPTMHQIKQALDFAYEGGRIDGEIAATIKAMGVVDRAIDRLKASEAA